MASSTGNDRMMRTTNLTIGAAGSQLDLTNNKAIVNGGSAGMGVVGTGWGR